MPHVSNWLILVKMWLIEGNDGMQITFQQSSKIDTRKKQCHICYSKCTHCSLLNCKPADSIVPPVLLVAASAMLINQSFQLETTQRFHLKKSLPLTKKIKDW